MTVGYSENWTQPSIRKDRIPQTPRLTQDSQN
uniref:Uncharacterized protein n=1 Tax=viral metagenome TaxID=1070528 RepID=A0A6C0BP72_9ZZZZ